MVRYHDIQTLPLQKPSTTEFSSSDLNWSKVNGRYQNVDNVALIPFSSVEDFVRGERSSAECPTQFRVDTKRKQAEGRSCLEYKIYWCRFGPDDRRKGGTCRPSRKCIEPSKKKRAGRPHKLRGCVCHFIVQRFVAMESVAVIIYNEQKHVDKSGSPSHGLLADKAIGTRFMYASYKSNELQFWITSMLYAGSSVESIRKVIETDGGPINCDDLFHKYVQKVKRDIGQLTYKLHSDDDAVSVKIWVEKNRSKVFYYQGSSDTDAFILGIQTEWQLQQMIHFGNNNLLAVDSSFGVKKFKYPVYTLLVFDSNQIAIPIAWIISASFSSHDVHKWMRTLHDRVCAKDSLWRLNGFIVDDALTETAKIRDVFQCPTLLCLWRLRHAWHRNIIKKCTDSEMQREMLKCLGPIMYSKESGSNVLDAMARFMEVFKDHSAFMEFKAQWMPKIEMWATAMRTLPLASQETCAAIEAFHSNLKSKLFNETDTGAYQRIDWLVHKLTTEVHSYYWFDHFSEENDFCGYMRDGELASNSWHRALYIADSDVILNDKDLQFAKVVSQSDRSRTHTVWNPGTEFAICDCSWSMSGNLCKHVIKAGMVCRDRQVARPSMAMQTYHQALHSLLQCPPNGSIVLDHAIALAIHMQQDLKRLLGPSNHRGTDPPLMLVPGKWVCKKSRTKGKVSTAEENNVVCGNRVSSDGDNEAISHKIASDKKAD